MALAPRPFYELLKMKFIIPPYQRGYRWDEEQVKALLNDLEDFIEKYIQSSQCNENSDIYYCLQPIAVVPEPQDDSDTNTYIVVDGQQRLTTIYLLLHYLQNSNCPPCPIYSLSMPNRKSQETYIQNCTFLDDNNTEYSENIDNFYIRKAYEAIKEWFSGDNNRAFNMLEFLKLFAFNPKPGQMHRDVRVIWYEITGATALDAFRRLNYGKIPLTSTELVKALLLQGESDPSVGEHRRGAAYRRALEWDEMEHTLQNPYLWSMLASQSEDSRAHLGLILDFVADNLNKNMSTPFVRKAQPNKDVRDYFNYNVVNEFLRRNSTTGIEQVWDEIRRVFNLIVNWYDSREWYHLIGLLRILPSKSKLKSRREFVEYIYRMSVNGQNRPVDRLQFTDALKNEICKIVKNIKIEELAYNEENERIIQILMLLNVKEAIMDQTEESRFAFHLFETFKVSSLEHIHPQNITTDDKYDDFKNWVDQRSEDFKNLTDEDLKKVVISRNEYGDIEELIKKCREETNNAIVKLKGLTATPVEYADEKNKSDLQEYAKTLDKIFGDLSGIEEKDLHAISNLALVDQPTNSALQNFFLNQKRELLMARHHKGDTYAPPATRHVFCKEYSRETPGDMRLWRKEDRDAYYEAIIKAYNYFIN